ncbi:MAG: efflux RND transporter permease subunit, partial [Pirellulales bacterium]
MSTLFFRNRRLLILAILLIVVAGLAGYESMPRLEDPKLTQRFARIVTRYPGAKAERIEALVTEKLEERLFEIEELKVLESESTAGVSTLVIELNDHVTEVDEVWSRVRDKLDDAYAELPSGALEPDFEEQEVRAYALIAALAWRYDSPPNYAVLRRLAEQLEDRLRALPGTEQIDLAGDPDEEITVEIRPAELAARGISVADISRQLAQSDARVSAGQLRSARGDLLIEVENQYDSLQRVRQTPIRFGTESQTVQLADISEVRKGIVQPQADVAIVDGRPAIAVGALIESNRRIDYWAEDAHKALDEFQADLPDGVELSVIFDQSVYTTERLASLMGNLFMGAVAVVVVIWLLMGWRSSIVVGAALPLSALMVFAGMHLLGVPIHQMSVSGLIIALGLLIDNAIVMVDEIRTRLHAGRPTVQAISQSVKHLAVPLAGSTVTTALAFMPIALMPGGAGEFVGSIAISVVLAIFSSLLLAMTVIPALAGLMDGIGPYPRNSSWWNVGVHSQRLLDVYRRSLQFLFARPALGILLGVALPIVGFMQARTLPEQFFPPADRDMFQVEMELPSHTSLEETRRTALAVRQKMMDHPRVENVHWFIGESAPSFYYNLVKQREHASQYAQAIVQLNSAEDWQQNIRGLQTQLDNAFPETRLLVRQLEQGPPFKAPIEVRLYGADLMRLRQLGDEVRVILAGLPDTLHTASTLADAQPKFGIQLD